MKKIIIANLKMNLLPSETKEYFVKLTSKHALFKSNIVVCTPFTSLAVAKYLTTNTQVCIGAQNVCLAEEGAWTGEISAKMIKDTGCEFVIVGHCERRNLFKETNLQINKKIKSSLKQGLKIIFCIGETLAEKNSQNTQAILKKQLEEGLKGLYENELESILIAYEPVWAVGSGIFPTLKEIEDNVVLIRSIIGQIYSKQASQKTAVIYGGSANQSNISKVIKINGVNGVLVGGASKDVDNFIDLIGKAR